MNSNKAETYQDGAIGSVHSIARKAEQLIESGADKVDGAIHSVSEKASAASATISQTSADIMSGAEDAYHRVLKEGKRRADDLEADIKKAPYTSIGLAFLGGVVLASLIKR